MPHLFLQALKSIAASRVVVEPFGPLPLFYTTNEALFPSPPPPSYVDWMGASENDPLGGSAHSADFRAALFLPLHAVVLMVAFFAVVLRYGETHGWENRFKRYLTKVPRHDYIAEISAPKHSASLEAQKNGMEKESDMKEDPKNGMASTKRRLNGQKGNDRKAPILNCYNFHDEHLARQIEAMVAEAEAEFANRKSKKTMSLSASGADLPI